MILSIFIASERSRNRSEEFSEYEDTRMDTQESDSPKFRAALNRSQSSHEQGEYDLENDVETRSCTIESSEESGIWPPLRSFTRYLRLW